MKEMQETGVIKKEKTYMDVDQIRLLILERKKLERNLKRKS